MKLKFLLFGLIIILFSNIVSAALQDGLISAWKWDGNYLDYYNLNNGTANGAASINTAQCFIGTGCLDLTTDNGDYIQTSVTNFPNLTSNRTYGCWFKATSLGGAADFIMAYGPTATTTNRGFGLYTTGDAGRTYQIAGYSYDTGTSVNGDYNWTLVTMTFNTTDKNWTFYQNSTFRFGALRTNANTSAALNRFGTGTYDTTSDMKGYLDECFIFNRILAPTEIANIYSCGVANTSIVNCNVTVNPPPVINSFTYTNTSLNSTSINPLTFTLQWSVSRYKSLTIDNGVGNVTLLTNASVAPSQTMTYTLNATSENGTTTATVTIPVANLTARSFYTFEDVSGTRVLDCMNNVNLTTNGTFTNNSIKNDYSLNMNKAGNGWYFGDILNLGNENAAFTFSQWRKMDNDIPANNHSYWLKYTPSVNVAYNFAISRTGTYVSDETVVWQKISGGGSCIIEYKIGNYTPNQSIFWTGVYNVSHLILYRNGTSVGSTTCSNWTGAVGDTNTTFFLHGALSNYTGNDYTQTNSVIVDTIDDLSLFPHALSAAGVSALWNNGNPIQQTGGQCNQSDIQMSLYTPLNYTYSRTGTINFFGNVTTIDNTWNISLIINGTSYGITRNISSTGLFNITSTSISLNNEYEWWFNATVNKATNRTTISQKRLIYLVGPPGSQSTTRTCVFNAGSIALGSITGCI
jgi:hypothetical protein